MSKIKFLIAATFLGVLLSTMPAVAMNKNKHLNIKQNVEVDNKILEFKVHGKYKYMIDNEKKVREYYEQNYNQHIPNEIHILTYDNKEETGEDRNYEKRSIYEYCKNTNKYVKTDIKYKQIDEIPNISKNIGKETINILDQKEQKKIDVNKNKYIELLFSKNYGKKGEFSFNTIDNLIRAKNYFKEKNSGQIPEEIHFVQYNDVSTEFSPYEYIENYQMYKYNRDINCYKIFSECKGTEDDENWEIKNIRYIPQMPQNQKDFNKYNISDEFFNIVDLNDKNKKPRSPKLYDLVDDVTVTLETKSSNDYFFLKQNEENFNEKKFKESLKYVLQEVIEYYKLEIKQNAIPKHIQFIIYKKCGNKKYKKYSQTYIFNEKVRTNDILEKYEAKDELKSQDIDYIPEFNTSKELNKKFSKEPEYEKIHKQQYSKRNDKESKFYINEKEKPKK